MAKTAAQIDQWVADTIQAELGKIPKGIKDLLSHKPEHIHAVADSVALRTGIRLVAVTEYLNGLYKPQQ